MTPDATSQIRAPARPALVALAAVVVYWLAEIVCEIAYYGPGGEIATWGLASALGQSAMIVIGLVLGHALVGRMDLVLRSVTLVFLLAAFLNTLVWLWFVRGGVIDDAAIWQALQNLLLLPQIALLIWLLRAPLRRWVLSGFAMTAVFLGTHEMVARYAIVGELYFFAADDTAESDYAPVDVEALYLAQTGLLDAEIAGLQAGTPGSPDVFALMLGGTARQSVFLSEVEKVGPLLDELYGSGPRSLRLANSDDDPMRYPMANRANLARALAAIGDLQGPEDLAFLFLTSHGGEDLFSLDFYEAGTRDLTAAEFRQMLTDSGIGPAVIVISACHSGSFIDDLAAPNRLIIAAARADRTSFGCRDGAEWTEFGQSFFDRALRVERDPRKAFALAADDVTRKEAAEGLTHSLPQMSEGAAVGAVLDRVLAGR